MVRFRSFRGSAARLSVVEHVDSRTRRHWTERYTIEQSVARGCEQPAKAAKSRPLQRRNYRPAQDFFLARREVGW
ncbi:MAG: hypothetical protein RIS70_677 [Planctomycetota bacterium]